MIAAPSAAPSIHRCCGWSHTLWSATARPCRCSCCKPGWPWPPRRPWSPLPQAAASSRGRRGQWWRRAVTASAAWRLRASSLRRSGLEVGMLRGGCWFRLAVLPPALATCLSLAHAMLHMHLPAPPQHGMCLHLPPSCLPTHPSSPRLLNLPRPAAGAALSQRSQRAGPAGCRRRPCGCGRCSQRAVGACVDCHPLRGLPSGAADRWAGTIPKGLPCARARLKLNAWAASCAFLALAHILLSPCCLMSHPMPP